MKATGDNPAAANQREIQRYYRRHAPVYDATRWTFLFGRSRLLKLIAEGPAPANVLEVGCGTARNLVRLADRFPEARFTGVDLSPAMLAQARRRTQKAAGRFQWVQAAYDRPLGPAAPFELLIFSYSLSMMNPGWEAAITAAAADLAPGGRIAAVDFHETPFAWFRRWMQQHQVDLGGHLLPALCKCFRPRLATRAPAYWEGWEYFLFLGTKRAAAEGQAGSANDRFRPGRGTTLGLSCAVAGGEVAPASVLAEPQGCPAGVSATGLTRTGHGLGLRRRMRPLPVVLELARSANFGPNRLRGAGALAGSVG